MHRVVSALAGRRRCVVLVGAGGIGKTALATTVCHYLRLRHLFPDGTYHVDARGLQSVLQLIYATVAALSLPTTAEVRV